MAADRFALGELVRIVKHGNPSLLFREGLVRAGWYDKEAQVARYTIKTDFGLVNVKEEQLGRIGVS